MAEQVIISDTVFDVPADNYEEFDQELDAEKLGQSLIQANTLKGTRREFQFYADDNLLLSLQTKKKSIAKKYRVNLAWFSSEPEHNKVIVWKWLYGAIASCLLMALSIFFTLNNTIDFIYGAVATTVLITAMLISILLFFYHMRDEYIFKSRFGDIMLFITENKKPEQTAFDQFYISLQQCIDKAQQRLTVAERLVGELKMCRRLRDEGIINDESYTTARTAIFKHQQYKV